MPPILPQGDKQSPSVPPKLPQQVPPVIAQTVLEQVVSSPPPSAAANKSPNSETKQCSNRVVKTAQQKIRFAVVTGFFLLVLIGVGVFVNKTYCSPRNSIRTLILAIDRRDRETIAEYVDAPAIAEGLRKYALESYRRNTAKTQLDDGFNLWLNHLGEEISNGVFGVTFTPESVIAMMCGEEPKEAMKQGLADSSDRTIDAFTKDGSPKTKVYGSVFKMLIRSSIGFVLDKGIFERFSG